MQDITKEILQVVSTGLINEQRTLVSVKEMQQKHSEAAAVLDPLVTKLDQMCGYLTELRNDLRMAAVAQRT